MANSFTLFTPRKSLIHSLTSMKTQPVINQHADVTPGNRACYDNTLSLVGRVLSHFLLDPGPMNVTINRQINKFVT